MIVLQSEERHQAALNRNPLYKKFKYSQESKWLNRVPNWSYYKIKCITSRQSRIMIAGK